MLKISDFDISTDSPETHQVHRIGSDIYANAISLSDGDTIDNFEEVTVDEAELARSTADAQADRARKISQAIRARYSIDDELAILRQRDAKPEEFAEYNAFDESIKSIIQ